MGEIVPFDRRTDAERGLADSLVGEIAAEKAYEVAVERVAYWTQQVALERRAAMHLISYADPLSKIHDLDEAWEGQDGSL